MAEVGTHGEADSSNTNRTPPSTGLDTQLAFRLISLQGLLQGLALTLFISVSAALFLVEFGSEALPWTYLCAAVVTPLISVGYNRIERRVSTGNLVIATLGITTFIFGGSWVVLENSDAPWLLFALMVLSAPLVAYGLLVQNVQTSLFFDVREMKEVVPKVLAFSLLGVILAGILTPVLLIFMPLVSLMAVAAAFGLAMTGTSAVLARTYPELFDHPTPPGLKAGWDLARDQPVNGASFGELWRDRFFRQVFRYQFLSELGTLLVLFLFLDLVSRRFADDADNITTFFAVYEIGLRTLTVVVLLAIVAPLLHRFGVRFGLLSNPVTVTVSVAVFWIVTVTADVGIRPLFWLAVATRSLDMIFTLSSTTASVRTIYQIFPHRERFASITAIEGIAVPVATGFGGATLLVLDRVFDAGDSTLLLYTLVVCGLWTWSSHQAAQGYRRTLVSRVDRPSLDGLRLDVDVLENRVEAQRLLASDSASDVRLAMSIMQGADSATYTASLVKVLAMTNDDDVVVEALEQLATHHDRNPSDRPTDPSPADREVEARLAPTNRVEVRAAAIHALAAIAPELAPPEIEPLLASSESALRGAATIALLTTASGHPAANSTLQQLVSSEDPADRIAGADVLSRAPSEERDGLLSALLADDQDDVRAAAVRTVGASGNARFTAEVFRALDHGPTRAAATAAIAELGDDALPGANHALRDPAIPPTRAARILRACTAGPTPAAHRFAASHITQSDPDIRAAAIRAMATHAPFDEVEVDTAALRQIVASEAARVTDLAATHAAIPASPAFDPLRAAVETRVAHHRTNVFGLLSVLYRTRSLVEANRRLAKGNEAAALARETIDTVVNDADRALVARLIDASTSGGASNATERAFTDALSVWNDDWCAATAAYGIADSGGEPAVLGIDHPSFGPFHRNILRWAQHDRPTYDDQHGSPMALVEKVAVLKRCTIFATTADHVLAEVAIRSDCIELGPGERLISFGSSAEQMYVIVSGELEASRNGKRITVMGPGEAVGELAIFDDAPRAADVTAVSSCELLRIDREDLSQLVAEHPEVAHGIISALAQRLRSQGEHLAQI